MLLGTAGRLFDIRAEVNAPLVAAAAVAACFWAGRLLLLVFSSRAVGSGHGPAAAVGS